MRLARPQTSSIDGSNVNEDVKQDPEADLRLGCLDRDQSSGSTKADLCEEVLAGGSAAARPVSLM